MSAVPFEPGSSSTWSRPSRARRALPRRGLPHGVAGAASQKQWLTHVEEHPALAHLRSDTRGTLLHVARQLAFAADWESMTSRPGRAWIAQHANCSLRTVSRHISTLKSHGLLVELSPGRTRTHGKVEHLAPVYALTVMSPLRAVEQPTVDEDVHPSLRSSEKETPTRTRSSQPGQAWPAATPTHTKADRILAAQELKTRVPVLRSTSAEAVAAALREYFLAGWCVLDVVKAVDFRPDGTMWPHDGARGVRRPARWLAYRLGAWRLDGTVPPSPTLTAAAQARERVSRQLAAREHTPDVPPPSTVNAGLLAVRAVLALNAARRAEQRRLTHGADVLARRQQDSRPPLLRLA